jgi:DNA invertase Pin-like site-specific DNA recombinase
MKKAAIYVRVSTDQQTIKNQVLILTEVARRSGWEIVQVFADEGISGAKGRDRRPGFDALLKAVTRFEVEIVMAFAVDRLGRSLSDLVGFLSEIQARGCDLYLHQQAIDTSTPAGRMLFQLLGVFAEFERTIIASRVIAGQARARASGVKFGRPPLAPNRVEKVRRALADGRSIRAIAKATGVSTATVQRVKRSPGHDCI